MSNKTALVVDDDLRIGQLVKTILTSNGFDVLSAQDGQGARAILKETKPDLIIMDIMLPDEGGGEIISSVKKDPDLLNVPVIFLSGIANQEDDNLASEVVVGNKQYPALAKPFNADVFLQEVKKALEG